ncbi:DUF952 domain-containing protein [Paenibacillus sp. 2KB_22]|uniref:DUF952 domain-containing protein n=1 Tax=Paenibacillus sp. 2KB_22 TaxID=3232978 RepID=UPI003F97C822
MSNPHCYRPSGNQGNHRTHIEEGPKIRAEVIWEYLYNEGREYPHIYGELNLDAVLHTYDFEPDTEGRFLLPTDLEGIR